MSHVGLNASAPQQHAARTQGTRQLLYKQQPAICNPKPEPEQATSALQLQQHEALCSRRSALHITKLTETKASDSEYQNKSEPSAWHQPPVARSQKQGPGGQQEGHLHLPPEPEPEPRKDFLLHSQSQSQSYPKQEIPNGNTDSKSISPIIKNTSTNTRRHIFHMKDKAEG
jgi:hypothetical protein